MQLSFITSKYPQIRRPSLANEVACTYGLLEISDEQNIIVEKWFV